ncbi:MAG: hypothetical protein ACR2QW_02120 [bacterium]
MVHHWYIEDDLVRIRCIDGRLCDGALTMLPLYLKNAEMPWGELRIGIPIRS